MEVKENVRIVKISLYCDKCGKEMKHNGRVLMSNPAQYSHVCECGYVVNSPCIYPYIAYLPEEK
jgi:uncharacterized Zn finger protein